VFPTEAPPAEPPHRDAGPAVTGPAVGILVIGVAALLVNGFLCFSEAAVLASPSPDIDSDMHLILLVALSGAALASLVTIVSGILMLNRKLYTLSLVGCFLAMLPIGVCFIVGLPLGIWGVTTLMRADVRATFT
jgi:hypothetical protein